jgi:hypothetical protein
MVSPGRPTHEQAPEDVPCAAIFELRRAASFRPWSRPPCTTTSKCKNSSCIFRLAEMILQGFRRSNIVTKRVSGACVSPYHKTGTAGLLHWWNALVTFVMISASLDITIPIRRNVPATSSTDSNMRQLLRAADR